ncbi:Putative disease resistance TIR-NBS-LRR class protein [Prunus dulcis]|uniref:ADP-ribosyl cyclase/cyclic ADP-ribose hydrolase n=1 Tax=Prunus dulcis TaxID=3755 RepID=A0A5H2XVZ5_PRUDU|nr:Putative disease resistance TIR-NBS-LRR class protein [Prunus dulcis]
MRIAIEESQISAVILSKNYATSTWCLDELATMVELAANTKSRLILPVFYDVTPSEVREQTGEHFKEVFAQHDKDFKGEPGKVTRWKESLTEIANLSGFDVRGLSRRRGTSQQQCLKIGMQATVKGGLAKRTPIVTKDAKS